MTKEAEHNRKGFLWGLVMLVSGTMCTIITKVQYGMRAEGREICIVNGTQTTNCLFDKPWFGVFQMKLAMAFCIVILMIRQKVQKRSYLETPVFSMQKHGKKFMATPKSTRHTTERTPLTSAKHETSWETIVWILFPSFLDLLNTILANIGLLWVSSSIYQMSRGSVVLFNAIFSVRFMGKKLFAYHYVSIFIVMSAVFLVAYAGVMQSNAADEQDAEKQANQLLGLSLIFLSQLITAIQIVVEEWFLTERHVSPMTLVGWEGIWGLVFFVVLTPLLMATAPGTSALSKIWHEDVVDTFIKMSNSWAVTASVVLYIVLIGLFNLAANFVTKYLSSVVRSILDTLRTLGVWVLSLFIYYVLRWRGANSPGEQWTVWSWLELAGFAAMVAGTLAYKKIFLLPAKWLYEAEEKEAALAFVKSPFMSNMH
ncbi:unnamed protein product [Aphanomyces euteiches]|uniref:EamA domain-containing protein n=1 Tax=Aphanomyces euteiches TaxID=100861 RepID=A0A6G0XQB0_9STRA|nr:hypothetical protein Ae201684_002576 [Aphanomyces euteiches]KAH9093289.1 hypothetical protein Ae201684P_008945 [Aphanomyces euteiches]KAH9146339.1 hypothetical protein AeRB84_009817 [Aphanomyces euteiches]